MKIKKKTSLMMVAASAAAIMGVAAVSFAAWQGGANDSITANASTGHVELVGFTSSTADALDALVPVDQGSGNTISSTSVSYVVTETSTITAKYAITTAANAVSELELWVKLSDTELAAPAKADVKADNGWYQLGTSAVTLDNAVAASDTEVTKYVNVVLLSDDLADMDQTYTLTLEIAKN